MISEQDVKIEVLLRRTPSGPDFCQPTITYVDESIEVATAKFGEVLLRYFPDARIPISTKLQEITRSSYRELPKSSFVTECDRSYLSYPSGSKYFLNRLGEAIYLADPDLGVFQYIAALYPSRNARDNYQRFPWFNNRLTKIIEVGGLNLDDPRIKYIAVGYVTQVGKAFTITKAQELLKKAQLFAGLDSAERATTYLGLVGEMVGQLRIGQRFVLRGNATMDNIAEGAGLDGQQTRLLLDLAFIRNKAFDQPAEFKQALEPLIRLVASGDWEEAFQHRDFLLTYFLTSFPRWVGREYRATGEVAFESFKDLARAVVQHRLIIHDEEVPSEYKRSFGDIFPKKVERAQKERDEAIVRRSLNLSNAVVKELAVETENMIREYTTQITFGYWAEEVKAIITDQSKSISDRYDEFLGIMMSINPEIDEDDIEHTFNSLSSKLNEPPEASLKTPYILRIPGERPVLAVEMMENKQVCWYSTEYSVGVKLKGGEREVMAKNWVNFGRVLHNIILLAYQQPPGKAVLNTDQVKTALNRAYEEQKRQDPIVSLFTLSDYLRALLNTVPFKVKLTEEDPVMCFIRELEG